MRRPPWSFWVLLACTGVLIAIVVAASRRAGPPEAEAQFRERIIEAELRFQEASYWAVPDRDPSEARRALAEFADEAAALARSPDTPPFVREQVAAIWLIFGETDDEKHPSREEAITNLLPPPNERGPLGVVVERMATGKAGKADDFGALADVPVSEWLRSRLHAHLDTAASPLPADSPHAREEQRFLGNLAMLGLVYLVFGVAGLVLLVGMPYFWRRAGAWTRVTAPPRFAPELWVGAYVLMAWFVFYAAIQLGLAGLERLVPPLQHVSPAVTGVVLQLMHGVFGLWAIGRFGMADGLMRLRPVLHELRVGLEPFSGRVLRPILWGLAGYAVAIPLVWLFAYFQSLLPIDTQVVSNPVLPLLADPPDAVSQILLIAAVVAVAPFFEECLFRGFLYRHLRARLGVMGAAAISALLFSAIHLEVGTLLPLFALGMVLALVAERSGGILPSMLVHSLWNGTQVLVTVTLFGA